MENTEANQDITWVRLSEAELHRYEQACLKHQRRDQLWRQREKEIKDARKADIWYAEQEAKRLTPA